jgi:sigma-B regulation protein RsbU (phosphoserine phosphatase)
LRRRGHPAAVDEVGSEIVDIPLGVFDRPYEEKVIPLEVGDALLLYTDGATESRNPQDQLYGVERLQEVVRGAPEGMEALGTTVLTDIQRFASGRPQPDDLTLVGFCRTA